LIITGTGSSYISGLYGAYIMRELGVFNIVRVMMPHEIRPTDLKDIKYGGFLSLSQGGCSSTVIEAVKNAYRANLTCFNIVNVENSPITYVLDQVQKEMREARKSDQQQEVIFNASDSEEEESEESEDYNDLKIGLY